MTTASLLLAALLTSPSAAASADEVPAVHGGAQETELTRRARRMSVVLSSDPSAARRFAERILRSSIASDLSGESDPAAALAEVEAWVRASPEDASHLAVGFADDDASGTDDFERSLHERVRRWFALNPGRDKGLLGLLERTAAESRGLSVSRTEDPPPGGDRPSDGGAHASAGPPSGTEVYASSPYDRLSAANPSGYSPEVLALQSELNRSSPPGAPRLPETGKLDHATLSHPAYALRRDIAALESSLQASAEDDPSRAARRAAIEAAKSALAGFEAEVARTRAPGSISPSALRSLAKKRREAARWIVTASLEEKARRLRLCRELLGEELFAAVGRVPEEEEVRRAYLARGRRLAGRLEAALSDAREALSLLSKETADLPRADTLIASVRSASRDLPPQVLRYAEVASRLASSRPIPRSGLRSVLDSLSRRLRPDPTRARDLREEQALRVEFRRIAATP